MSQISPCLWFDNQAEEAAQYYTSIFKNSRITNTARYTESGAQVSGQKKDSVMTVEFELDGIHLMGLNGGTIFKFTPAFSLFVWCETEKEIDELWKKLSAGGQARMGLDKYPWAQKYGWTTDKFGVEWQLILSEQKPIKKMAPCFLFVDKLFGQGEAALKLYQKIFPRSQVQVMMKDEKTNTIQHCQFTLDGNPFVLMEGEGTHHFTFSHAFSLMVDCQTQKDIDYYWKELTADGGSEEPCGWVQDKYGVSWQIAPFQMSEYMSNPKTAEKAMKAMIQMKKIDLAAIQAAVQLE